MTATGNHLFKSAKLVACGAVVLLALCGCTTTTHFTCRNYTDYAGPVEIRVNGKHKATTLLNGKGDMQTVKLRLRRGTHDIHVKSQDGATGAVYVDQRKKGKHIMAVRDKQRPTGFGFLVQETPLKF